MTTQLQFPGVHRREPQGNRGRVWQDILDRTHEWYRRQNRGRVYSIRNEWSYAPKWLWDKQPQEMRARTASGGLLMRFKSAPDYVGSLGRWPIQFDAKEFDGSSIPYANFKPRQIEDLHDSFVGGNRFSGFMVLEKRTMNVYWCAADFVFLWHTNVKRAVAGTAKSLNFSKLVDARVRVLGRCDGYRFDYAPALIAGFTVPLQKAA